MQRVKISCVPLYYRIGSFEGQIQDTAFIFFFLITQKCAVTLLIKGEMVVLGLAEMLISNSNPH